MFESQGFEVTVELETTMSEVYAEMHPVPGRWMMYYHPEETTEVKLKMQVPKGGPVFERFCKWRIFAGLKEPIMKSMRESVAGVSGVPAHLALHTAHLALTEPHDMIVFCCTQHTLHTAHSTP